MQGAFINKMRDMRNQSFINTFGNSIPKIHNNIILDLIFTIFQKEKMKKFLIDNIQSLHQFSYWH